MHHMDSSLLHDFAKYQLRGKRGHWMGKGMVRAMNRKENEDGELSFRMPVKSSVP